MRITERVRAEREEGTSLIAFVAETTVEGVGTMLVRGKMKENSEQTEIEECVLPEGGIPLDIFLIHLDGLRNILRDVIEYFSSSGGETEYTYTLTFEM